MTKHIVGLVLFTFIVGTSAGIAGLFGEPSKQGNSFSLRENFRVFKRKRKKRRCRKRRRPRFLKRRLVSTGITKAVFDEESGLLLTKHSLRRSSNSKERKTLVYHFYVKDEFGTHYARSKRISGAFSSSITVNGIEWLVNRRPKNDLYIMSEYVPNGRSWKKPLEFDGSKAVLIRVKSAE